MPILAPFEAFANDAEVLKVSEDGSRLPVRWLAAAQIAARLSDARPRERKALLKLWERQQASGTPDSAWAAISVPEIRVHDLASAAETLCVIAADMERGGAFHLAYSTVTHLRIAMLDRGPAGVRGLATLQQARVLRQMSLLDEAQDTYEQAREDGIRARDTELEGRALQGLGVVAGHRGNFPEVRKYATAALQTLAPDSEYAALAHGDLMIASKATGDFTSAFEHGWRGYDASAHDVEQRAGIVCNLASLALRCGHFAAARRGFVAALGLTPLDRIRIPALGGLALVSAAARDASELMRVSALIDRASATTTLHYEFTQARFELAQAWQEIGDLKKAEQYLARARNLAVLHSFHEFNFRSELLAEAIESARVRSARDARMNMALARFDSLPAGAVLEHA